MKKINQGKVEMVDQILETLIIETKEIIKKMAMDPRKENSFKKTETIIGEITDDFIFL